MKVNDKVVWIDPDNQASIIVTINEVCEDNIYKCSNRFSEMEVYGNELKELNSVLCCEVCGNIDIQQKAWVYVNNYTFESSCSFDDEDNYCEECERSAGIVTVEGYLKNKEEDE